MEWVGVLANVVAGNPLGGIVLFLVICAAGVSIFLATRWLTVFRKRHEEEPDNNGGPHKSLFRRIGAIEQRLGATRLEEHFRRSHDMSNDIMVAAATAKRVEQRLDSMEEVARESSREIGTVFAKLESLDRGQSEILRRLDMRSAPR